MNVDCFIMINTFIMRAVFCINKILYSQCTTLWFTVDIYQTSLSYKGVVIESTTKVMNNSGYL